MTDPIRLTSSAWAEIGGLMWLDIFGGATELIGALAAFLAALTGLWLALRKLTRGKPTAVEVEPGAETVPAFDSQSEWRRERDRAERLGLQVDSQAEAFRAELDEVYADRDSLRKYAHKLELVLTRNNIPF